MNSQEIKENIFLMFAELVGAFGYDGSSTAVVNNSLGVDTEWFFVEWHSMSTSLHIETNEHIDHHNHLIIDYKGFMNKKYYKRYISGWGVPGAAECLKTVDSDLKGKVDFSFKITNNSFNILSHKKYTPLEYEENTCAGSHIVRCVYSKNNQQL